MPSTRAASMRTFVCVLLAGASVFGCAKSRAREHDGGGATGAASVAIATKPIAAPSGSACDGPVFDFGSQDRLRWGTEGALVRSEGHFGIDLGRKVRFHSAHKGDAITGVVELVCTTCSAVEREALETQLASMTGKRVRATGTLEPGWSQATAAPREVPLGVRLSVASADVALAPGK